MSDLHLDPDRRHDAVLLIDVTDGNPNGDPDAGNMPRVDPETLHGLMSDASIKRQVRDYVDLTVEGDRNQIYMRREDVALNVRHDRADAATGGGGGKKREDVQRRRDWLLDHYYDLRTFGAVMSTGEHGAGQVRGPVQITWARSIDPIVPQEFSITRVVKTNPSQEYDPEISEFGEMGRKSMVAYGLYRAQVYVNPYFARQSGFTAEDLGLLWDGLQYAWDLTRTASKGMMSCRGLYVFTHDRPQGSAHAHQLFDSVKVEKASDGPARSWSDYNVDVPDQGSPPEGVTLTRLVG